MSSLLPTQGQAPTDPVVSRLCHVTIFAIGGVGFASRKTQGEWDYRDISCRASAQSDFEEVLAKGTPEAKAYALVALYKLNPEKFKKWAELLRSSTESVNVGRGCVIGGQKMADFIKSIEAGGYGPVKTR